MNTIVELVLTLQLLAATVHCEESKETARHWYIVPERSSVQYAVCQNHSHRLCCTLSELSSQLNVTNHKQIILTFSPGDHLLTWNMIISNSDKVILQSESQSIQSRVTCLKEKTVIIAKVKVVQIKDITIFGCSGIQLKSTTATIQNVNFLNNKAKFGGALHVSNSQVSITNTLFSNNSVAVDGGAIYLNNTKLDMYKCSFTANSAKGSGGAVSAHCNTIHCRHLHFHSTANEYTNNTASKGGAVNSFVFSHFNHDTFEGNTAHSQGAALYVNTWRIVTVTNCNFVSNHVFHSQTEPHGAVIYILRAGLRFNGHNKLLHNTGSLYLLSSFVLFHGNLTISHNNNQQGCGGGIHSVASTLIMGYKFFSEITHNRANSGAGLCLQQSTLITQSKVFLLIKQNNACISGGGIHAFQSILNFDSSSSIQVHIVDNQAGKDGGGIYLTDSTITLRFKRTHLIDLKVEKNYAKSNGGGLYLDSTSSINIGTPENYNGKVTFKYNSAKRGGGIYVNDRKSRNCAGNKLPCFVQTFLLPGMQYHKKLVFAHNKAEVTGSDIFGGLLDRCRTNLLSQRSVSIYSEFESFQNVTDFVWANNRLIKNRTKFYNHIASEPVRVCQCKRNDVYYDNSTISVSTKKGTNFTLSLIALDQVGKPVKATIISSLNGTLGGFGHGQRKRQIKDRCTEVNYTVFSSKSKEIMTVFPQGPCGDQGISKQVVTISFQPCTCPKGFEVSQSNIACTCECDKQLSNFVSSCFYQYKTIQVDSNVWIKYISSSNNTNYVIHDCPFDYCREKPVNISLTDQDEQCAFNRTGTLCGECKQGLSLVFASSNCQHCSNYHLFLLLPFTLAGVVLVAFILMLNMTVATGTIHGIVFYANILTASHSIFLPFNEQNVLTVFISWINLDLGIETCFYHGMNSYDKFWLQLAFPAYVFFLIVIILLLCNHSQRTAHLIGKKNPEATLYTLVLLSYSKLIQVIITALQFTTIHYPDGTQKYLWLYDANILYFTVSHIPRFIVALVLTILGTGYTTILLFGQLFNRCSQYRLMKWTTHKYYIHFMKAHHAPFSDSHRYWLGLLLLARLTHIFVAAFADVPIVILFTGSLAFVLLLIKMMSKSLYSKWAVGVLETVMILNLGLLALLSLYTRVSYSSNSTLSIEHQSTLTTVSMSVTFTAFFIVALYNILISCRIIPTQLIMTKGMQLINRITRRSEYQPIPGRNLEFHTIERHGQYSIQDGRLGNDVDTHSNLPSTNEHGNQYDQLREPALDVLIPVQSEDYD